MELTVWVVDKLAKMAEAVVKDKVIARWTNYRAERFFQSLIEAVRDEINHDVPEEELNVLLDQMMSKEVNSETVFEAYRQVCLSRSREIGPRMIGILTATLLGEERRANPKEEAILDVAEHFGDSELRGIVEVVRAWQREERNGYDGIATVNSELRHAVQNEWIPDSSFSGANTGSQLNAMLGSWGEKLRSYGLVHEVVGERRQKYQAESLRHLGPNQEGTWISRTIIFREGYSELVDLIERADRASNASRVDE